MGDAQDMAMGTHLQHSPGKDHGGLGWGRMKKGLDFDHEG